MPASLVTSSVSESLHTCSRFQTDCSLAKAKPRGRLGGRALEAMAGKNSLVLGDLMSSLLTVEPEGSTAPGWVAASSGRDTEEVSEGSGQLDQDGMYGSAW